MNEVDKNGKKIRKQLEVDFVCNKGSKRYYIQSAYALTDKEKMEQEQRSLVNTGDGVKKLLLQRMLGHRGESMLYPIRWNNKTKG